MWLAYCEDRHIDPETFLFKDRNKAINFIREWMKDHVAHPEYLEEEENGEEFRITYLESDFATVTFIEIED